MKAVWTVARRELKAMFDTPTGYVLLVVFIVANSFLFFRQAFLSSTASLRPMLDLLPWLYLFFVPAVAMRSLAEDTRTGLLEVILSQPLTELELLLGKYLGTVLFLGVALLCTLPIPLALAVGADLQWGPIVAQYVGSMLLGAGLAGVGVWASCLTRSQITAFITALAVCFILILVGLNPLIVGLPRSSGPWRLGWACSLTSTTWAAASSICVTRCISFRWPVSFWSWLMPRSWDASLPRRAALAGAFGSVHCFWSALSSW